MQQQSCLINESFTILFFSATTRPSKNSGVNCKLFCLVSHNPVIDGDVASDLRCSFSYGLHVSNQEQVHGQSRG